MHISDISLLSWLFYVPHLNSATVDTCHMQPWGAYFLQVRTSNRQIIIIGRYKFVWHYKILIFALETDFSDRMDTLCKPQEKILKYTQFCLRNGGVGNLHALYGVVCVYHFDDLDWRIFSRTRMVMQVRTYLASFFATRACMEFSEIFYIVPP